MCCFPTQRILIQGGQPGHQKQDWMIFQKNFHIFVGNSCASKPDFIATNMATTIRPVLSIPLSKLDYAIEAIAGLLLAAIWVGTALSYPQLPDQIPVHFNAAGVPDGYGANWNIWFLPVIASGLFGLLTFVCRIPHHFNYPFEITPENARRAYSRAASIMRVLKMLITMMSAYLLFATIQTALGKKSELGAWFLPVVLLVLFLAVAGLFRRPQID